MAGAFVAVAAVGPRSRRSRRLGAGRCPGRRLGGQGGRTGARARRGEACAAYPGASGPVGAHDSPQPAVSTPWAPDAALPVPAKRTLQAIAFHRPSSADEARRPVPSVPGWHGRPLARRPFLECTRRYESKFAGGYAAVSPGGQYRGAYQFDRDTWDEIARHVGRDELVGVDPAAARRSIKTSSRRASTTGRAPSPGPSAASGLP